MKSERLIWEWDGKFFELVMDWRGEGPTILLLPALSSISTRHEKPRLELLAVCPIDAHRPRRADTMAAQRLT
jgi:hypothetical protein